MSILDGWTTCALKSHYFGVPKGDVERLLCEPVPPIVEATVNLAVARPLSLLATDIAGGASALNARKAELGVYAT